MGYTHGREFLSSVIFEPSRGRPYPATWCWRVEVECRAFAAGLEADVRLEALHRELATLHIRSAVDAAPAWGNPTLHPFTLLTAETLLRHAQTALHEPHIPGADLLRVTIWEHRAIPRGPVVTLCAHEAACR